MKMSGFYRTQPVGYTEQDWFVNAAALLKTSLTPGELLKALLDIEQRMGRVRTIKWGPRIIDLDLLFYQDKVIDEEDLTTPHPFMSERRFVLIPLADVAPDWVHPLLNQTPVHMLLNVDDDGQEVVRL